MNPEAWFGLASRVIGILLITLYGIRDLVDVGLYKLGYLPYWEVHAGYPLITGLLYLALGIYLLRGAPMLVDLAYSHETFDDEIADWDTDADGSPMDESKHEE